MKKKTLSNKEIRELNEKIECYRYAIDKKQKVEEVSEPQKLIIIDNQADFFYIGDKIIPTLKFILNNPNVLKKIIVDMGAVKFVVNGADIMRPGIVEIEDGISQSDPVSIVDKVNKKSLAIGEALFSSSEMRAMQSGKVIKNLHYVGDAIWKLGQEEK